MKAILQQLFEAELRKAKTAISAQEFEDAWIALQRAHMLGQKDAIAHTVAHWNMLKLAWKQRDFREVAGQLMPTLLSMLLTPLYGSVRSLRGGRANVSEAERLTVPEDLQQILDQ